MVRGDIIKYIHLPGQEYYGVVKMNLGKGTLVLDVITCRIEGVRTDWATDFHTRDYKVELVEAV